MAGVVFFEWVVDRSNEGIVDLKEKWMVMEHTDNLLLFIAEAPCEKFKNMMADRRKGKEDQRGRGVRGGEKCDQVG